MPVFPKIDLFMSSFGLQAHLRDRFYSAYPFIPLFSSFTSAPRTLGPTNGNSEVRAAAVILRILQIQSLSRQVAWFNSGCEALCSLLS